MKRRELRVWILVAALAAAALTVPLKLIDAGRSAAQAPVNPTPGEDAEGLYAVGCQSCHGPAGEGVPPGDERLGALGVDGEGPALTDVDPGTIRFYLSTGYMPLSEPDEVPKRSDPEYDPFEIEALVDYVAAFGEDSGEELPPVEPEQGDLAEGQKIFTESCAGCHQVLGEGGVIADGVAPELRAATDQEVAEAVRAGPYLMPSFSEKEIGRSELDSLVRYVAYTRDPEDEGGWGIGHIGPIPEGLAAWLLTGIVLVGFARLVGKRIGERQ